MHALLHVLPMPCRPTGPFFHGQPLLSEAANTSRGVLSIGHFLWSRLIGTFELFRTVACMWQQQVRMYVHTYVCSWCVSQVMLACSTSSCSGCSQSCSNHLLHQLLCMKSTTSTSSGAPDPHGCKLEWVYYHCTCASAQFSP